MYAVFVTQHEKTGLMCTKYTNPHYSIYLTFRASCTSFVNCIKFPMVYYTSSKKFIDKLCLGTKVWNFKVQISGEILCARKPYFLILGHILILFTTYWWSIQLSKIASSVPSIVHFQYSVSNHFNGGGTFIQVGKNLDQLKWTVLWTVCIITNPVKYSSCKLDLHTSLHSFCMLLSIILSDWIWENLAFTHNYKYLEMPILIIWSSIQSEQKPVAWFTLPNLPL